MGISLLLGVLVGIVLGLTGAGGGILAVPALVAGMGWSMQQAAPVALIAVAGGAALGAFEGWRKGLVRYKAALVMVLTGIPLTSLGITAAHRLPQRWLLGLFAVVMLIVAARLLSQSGANGGTRSDHLPVAVIDPKTGRFHWNLSTGVLFASIGAATGFMTGLLGVGGGFIVVPALRRYTNVSVHGIVATSLLVIAMVGTGGILSAVAHGVQLPMPVTLLFALATATGMTIGRKLAAHSPEALVQRIFSLVLVMVASGLIYKAMFID